MPVNTCTASAAREIRASLPDAFLNFDNLPAASLVDQRIVELLFSCSATTVWRRVQRGDLPQPQRYGQCTRWRVGDLRALLNGEIS